MPSIFLEPVVQPIIQCSGPYPWDGDEQLRTRLEDAGWSYAALIGVVDPIEIQCQESTQTEDRKKYGHLIQQWEGWPLWDNAEATTFVSEISGASRAISAAWLELNWNNGGEV